MNTMISLVLLVSFSILSVQSATCPASTTGNSKDTSYYTPQNPGKVNFVKEAWCHLKETSLSPNTVTGYFHFVAGAGNPAAAASNGDGVTVLDTDYDITGLTAGDHKYHVHNFGDIFSPDGATVENHFVGTTATRPAGGPQEVGLLNDGTPVSPDGDTSTGTFSDGSADLTGRNSILGRAIIIHGNGGADPLAKAAQCVIGFTAYATGTYTETNLVRRATVTLDSITNAAIGGEVTFELNDWNTVDVKVLASGFAANTAYYIYIYTMGDVSGTPMGDEMGNIYQGNVRYPISGGRANIGEVGATTSTKFTFTSDANGVIRTSFVDYEVDLNGLNSIIARGLLIHRNSDNAAIAQGVIGISRDGTYREPASPVGLSFANSVPAVIEAQATMTSTSSNLFREGYVQFKRLPADDPLFPGVRVRYHLIVTTTGTSHVLTIRTRGNFGGAPTATSPDVSGNPIFEGFFAGRESSFSQVGAVGDGVPVVANAYGVISGEFIDRSLWLGDYNSIIGRHVALSVAGGNNRTAIALGVIGRTVDSSDLKRDYPPPVVTAAECVLTGSFAGVLTLTQATPSSPVTISHSLGANAGAFGVAPYGNIFGDTTAGYLFVGSGTRYLNPTCIQAVPGALNDFPAASGNYYNISLSGSDSIIGRTLFVSSDSSYTQPAPGTNPVLGTQSRVGRCVVGIVTETPVNPTGTGIRYLPSVSSTPPIIPPEIPNTFNGSTSTIASLAILIISLISLMLAL